MLTEYLYLQYCITNRKIRAFGLAPAVGYALAVVLFLGLSFYLFQRTALAVYPYVFIALSFVVRFSERRRNDFLQICFGEHGYRRVRLLENMLVVLPFCLFLMYKQCFLMLFVLMACAMVMALVHIRTGSNWVLPTPFGKHPFDNSS